MGKKDQTVRKIIPVVSNKKKYNIFAVDLKKIYKLKKTGLPPLPAFDTQHSLK